MRTGLPCTKENEGTRDDGSHFVVLCTAYPVLGPGNKPAGFIELERDITGHKGEEKTSAVLNNLRFALARAEDCSWALRYTLDAALSLDGVESGCAFLVDPQTSRRTPVSTRGLTTTYPKALETGAVDQGPTVEIGPPPKSTSTENHDALARPSALATLRIRTGSRTAALVFLGLATIDTGASMRIALEALAEVAANAAGRIEAERSRRQQQARLRHALQNLPVPVICLDRDARVTMCNRAAEKLFSFRVGETLDESSRFLRRDTLAQVRRLLKSEQVVEPITIGIGSTATDRESLEMQVIVASFADEIDEASRLILIGDQVVKARAWAAARSW